MRAEQGAVGRIGGELRSLKSVGCATVSAATFGLLAFWLCHGKWILSVSDRLKTAMIAVKRLGVKGGLQSRQAL